MQHTSSHTRPWPMGRTGSCNPEHMPPPRALWAAVCRPAKWGGRTALPFSGYPANSHAPAIRGCRSSARGLPAVPNMPGTCPCSLPAVAAHATAASHSNRFAEPKATAILPRKPTGFGRAGAVCLARGAAARPLANRRNPRPRRSRVFGLISLEFLNMNCRICQVLSEHRGGYFGAKFGNR